MAKFRFFKPYRLWSSISKDALFFMSTVAVSLPIHYGMSRLSVKSATNDIKDAIFRCKREFQYWDGLAEGEMDASEEIEVIEV